MISGYKKLYFLGVALTISVMVNAQNILVGIGGGIGSYAMNSTKDYDKTFVNLLPFKPILTDNFPPYFFYKAEALYCFPKFMAVGINFHTTSTGSRLTLSDYSGNFKHDNIQTGIFPGAKMMLGKAPGKSNGLNFLIEGGASLSKMKISVDMNVFDESQTDKAEYKAQGFYVQPGVCYFRNITKQVKLCANVSYYYGFEKGYHLPGQKDQKLFDSESGNPIKPQWDGLRAGLTAYWNFTKNL